MTSRSLCTSVSVRLFLEECMLEATQAYNCCIEQRMGLKEWIEVLIQCFGHLYINCSYMKSLNKICSKGPNKVAKPRNHGSTFQQQFWLTAAESPASIGSLEQGWWLQSVVWSDSCFLVMSVHLPCHVTLVLQTSQPRAHSVIESSILTLIPVPFVAEA